MIKRILAFIIGVIFIVLVIQLGILSTKNPNYVVWFGLASALIAPMGLGAIKYTFIQNEKKVLESLSKVPEIEKLVNQAKTQEEKLRILEEERKSLIEVIKKETRKRAVIERKEFLEGEIIRIMDELKIINEELRILNLNNKEKSIISNEVEKLYERLKVKNDKDILVTVGKKSILFDLMFPVQSTTMSSILVDLLASAFRGIAGMNIKKKN